MNLKRVPLFCILFLTAMLICGCRTAFSDLNGAAEQNSDNNQSGSEQTDKPFFQYELLGYRIVSGRQGTAYDGGFYYVSGTDSLTKYDKDFNVVSENRQPFEGVDIQVNHLGDIDVHGGKLYAGIEWFEGGKAKHPAIAIYDAESLKLRRVFTLAEESGQTEISGITYDTDRNMIWTVSWQTGESGANLYGYSEENCACVDKIKMLNPPYHSQGVKYRDGVFYLTADDGNASNNEPDHLYRAQIAAGNKEAKVTLEKSFDDMADLGEIEGLTFDHQNRLYVIHNRGYHVSYGIIDGYDRGYNTEISEMYCYELK